MKLCIGSASMLIGLLATPITAAAQPVLHPATIHIANFAFAPQTLTISPGQRVVFINDDGEAHTATAVDKSFDSAGLDVHESWQHTFDKPGTYAYFCALHPQMRGTIVVAAPKP